jgi:hypothetical protein
MLSPEFAGGAGYELGNTPSILIELPQESQLKIFSEIMASWSGPNFLQA